MLKTICVIGFITFAAVLIFTLAKNDPWLVLVNKTLEARCYRLDLNGRRGKANLMVIPIERLERVWVGTPRDFPSELLIQNFDWRTYPNAVTLLFWLNSERDPYQVREFSWLSETAEFLERLRARGIRIECS